jgi:hypothetical protein
MAQIREYFTNIRAIIGAVLTIASLVGVVWAAEDRYATKAEHQQLATDAANAVEVLRLEMIAESLEHLDAKEQFGVLTEYDRVRRSRLEREWDELTKRIAARSGDGG